MNQQETPEGWRPFMAFPLYTNPPGNRRVVMEVAPDKYTPLDCVNVILQYLAANPDVIDDIADWITENGGHESGEPYSRELVVAQVNSAAHLLREIDSFEGHVLYIVGTEGMVN